MDENGGRTLWPGEAESQLGWWLRLPPVNLIDRGDVLRFRYALYLIAGQVCAALYGLNGRSLELSYPSSLQDTRTTLDRLSVAPPCSGERLTATIAATDAREAWGIAAALIADTLTLSVHTSQTEQASSPMAHAGSDRLRKDAETFVSLLSSLSGVEAVALSGSLARGLADRSSDVDIAVFCRELPPPADRRTALHRMSGVRRLLTEPACDTLWSDAILVHIRYWRAGDVDRLVAPIRTLPDLFLAEALQECRSLFDPQNRLTEWKTLLRQSLPKLSDSVAQQTKDRRTVFSLLWEKAVNRNDHVHLYCLANQIVNDFLMTLYVFHDRFMTTPKWVYKDIPQMATAPPQTLSRLEAIAGPIRDVSSAAARKNDMDALWAELPSIRP